MQKLKESIEKLPPELEQEVRDLTLYASHFTPMNQTNQMNQTDENDRMIEVHEHLKAKYGKSFMKEEIK